jgi:hypothetical protein
VCAKNSLSPFFVLLMKMLINSSLVGKGGLDKSIHQRTRVCVINGFLIETIESQNKDIYVATRLWANIKTSNNESWW